MIRGSAAGYAHSSGLSVVYVAVIVLVPSHRGVGDHHGEDLGSPKGRVIGSGNPLLVNGTSMAWTWGGNPIEVPLRGNGHFPFNVAKGAKLRIVSRH